MRFEATRRIVYSIGENGRDDEGAGEAGSHRGLDQIYEVPAPTDR